VPSFLRIDRLSGSLARPASASLRDGHRIPWYLWCATAAVTSAYIGGYWDISWHRSIGRDSFWAAPHLAMYACGILAGLSAAYLIVLATFGGDPQLRARSVRIWGLRGPLGAFICAWGGLAMLVSAPFDNWWHAAYGLDVRIISPPHTVLAVGFFGIEFGTIMLLLAYMNRATDDTRRALQQLFLLVGGIAFCESMLFKLEYIDRSDMHTSLFYTVVVTGSLAFITAVAVASHHRWASTIVTLVYTLFGVAFLWVLPLFPATPKLGPVYNPVTHFIPWEFPLLLIVPAAVLDLALNRTTSWRPLVRAPLLAAAFLGAFVAVQWPFANFLMSPRARNRFFGAAYMDFSTRPNSPYAQFVFFTRDATAADFWRGMLFALAVAFAMTWLGLHAGRLAARVRR